MNKVILVGNMTRDPEVRYTNTGKAVATFTIAVNTGFRENKRTDFVPIVTWEKLAELCGNNLIKGKRILVEGRLQIRDFETKEGAKRRVAEIIAQNIEFLSARTTENTDSKISEQNESNYSKLGEILPDEEIPF